MSGRKACDQLAGGEKDYRYALIAPKHYQFHVIFVKPGVSSAIAQDVSQADPLEELVG